MQRIDNVSIRLADTPHERLAEVIIELRGAPLVPPVSEEALREFKFGDLLPPNLAVDVLTERYSDPASVKQVLDEPVKGVYAY